MPCTHIRFIAYYARSNIKHVPITRSYYNSRNCAIHSFFPKYHGVFQFYSPKFKGYNKFDSYICTSAINLNLDIVNSQQKSSVVPFYFYNESHKPIQFLEFNKNKFIYKSTLSNSNDKPTQEESNSTDKSLQPNKPKKSLWIRFKNEIIHYYHGFRLLGLETKIAGGICIQLLMGKTLSRRERNQLVRTAADIFRLVPFAVFIVVPFMEFLLPVYIKFFPFMMPSTFKEKKKEEEKMRQTLKGKLEMARFLQETVTKTSPVETNDKNTPTIQEFQDFMAVVRHSGQLAKTTDIVRFSRLFEDQFTLDSLEHGQLKALCQLLEIPSIGPSNLLRFQLWLRVRQLRAEDQLIAKEDVSQIPPWELQTLSRDRGMRSLGLTEERLRSQLKQWLKLHLQLNVPISLLLLSRAMYLQDTTLPAEQQLQKVISVLPIAASEEAAVKVLESTKDVDLKTKIDLLRKEQQSIKAERAADKQRKSEEKKKLEQEAKSAEKAALIDKADTLVDKAEILTEKSSESLIDNAKPLESIPSLTSSIDAKTISAEASSLHIPHHSTIVGDKDTKETTTDVSLDEPVITSQDLGDIAQAIQTISESGKTSEEVELNGLKAEVEETAKKRREQKSKTIAAESAEKDVSTTVSEQKKVEPPSKSELSQKTKSNKAVARIEAEVDRIIDEISGVMSKISAEKKDLLKDIQLQKDQVEVATEDEDKNKIFESIRVDQQRLVDIMDVLEFLQQMQQQTDLNRLQRILNALDEDRDGKLEVKHVLAVCKLFESEDAKLNTKQMADVMEMLEQEELVQEYTTADDADKDYTEPEQTTNDPSTGKK